MKFDQFKQILRNENEFLLKFNFPVPERQQILEDRKALERRKNATSKSSTRRSKNAALTTALTTAATTDDGSDDPVYENPIHKEDKEKKAATVIQARQRGVKARRELASGEEGGAPSTPTKGHLTIDVKEKESSYDKYISLRDKDSHYNTLSKEARSEKTAEAVEKLWREMRRAARERPKTAKLRRVYESASLETAWVRHEVAEFIEHNLPFATKMAEVESQFGGSIKIIYSFMIWLLYLNAMLGLMWTILVVCPWFFRNNFTGTLLSFVLGWDDELSCPGPRCAKGASCTCELVDVSRVALLHTCLFHIHVAGLCRWERSRDAHFRLLRWVRSRKRRLRGI